MHKILFGTMFSLLLLSTSCDLDKFPDDSITTETAWQSISDAEKFRNGMYGTFMAVNGGIYTYIPDYQTDVFNATISFSNRGGDIYRWDFTSSQYDIEDTYEYNYECINNCNNILQNIDKITIEDADEQARADMIKGEAYLIRALCYHTLVVRFAKDYEPSSATSDLGMPLVLEMDPEGKPSRATLEETYKQIKSDISESRKLLKTEGTANAIYMTMDVIDAFEARVDLYMHNYSDAITLAKKIIAKYPLITTEEGLASMWLNDKGSEIVFKVFMSQDERKTNQEMQYYLNYNTGANLFSPDFVPTKWVVDLYEDNDIRKQVYFLEDSVVCNSTKVGGVYLLNKYPGNPELKTSTYQYYQMPKIFRAAESYLIAAEAAYNEGNTVEALEYINNLRVARQASSLNLNGEAVFKAIKDEWIREFIGEGHRLNDLKRWHDGFSRHDTQTPSIIMSGANYNEKTVSADDQRFVWEFPANDLKANSNLIPNWK